MMAQGRREQMRIAMLPHLGGKFSVERFLRTGNAGQARNRPLPDTPEMRAAIEQLDRERAELEARLKHGQ